MPRLAHIVLILGISFATACGGCADDLAPLPLDECIDGGCVDVGMQSPRPDAQLGCAEPPCDCAIDEDGGFCIDAYCRVTVNPGALQDSRVVVVEALTASSELDRDVLGRRLCAVDAPDDLPLEVAITYRDEDLPMGFGVEEVVAVELVGDQVTRLPALLDSSNREVLVPAVGSGTFGASVSPLNPTFGEELGIDRFEVFDEATYVRNLSRYDFGGSFHDGVRFYAGNGPRLLIWNDGIPDDPLMPPDVVLGRPDLSTNTPFASSASFAGSVKGIWSNGTKLAVAESHRVLLWNEVPAADFAPADIVLGQSDFVTSKINRQGPVAANTLASPDDIWSDGERFIVADTLNHRFLIWNTFPATTGQPADMVLGQEDFDENPVNGGSLPAYQARSAYFDGSRLAVSSTFAASGFAVFDGFPTTSNPTPDYWVGLSYVLAQISEAAFIRPDSLTAFGDGGLLLHNNWRASIWRSFPLTDTPSDLTLGKPDSVLGGVLGRVSAASFSSIAPTAQAFSRRDNLMIADGPRLLIWRSLPETNFRPADLVLGQPSAATPIKEIDYRGLDVDTLAYPAGISVFGGVSVIADRGNSRVLVIRGDLGNPESVVVLGQPDGTSFGPNRGWGAASDSTLNDPTDVFTDGKNVIVADAGNHRVLIWTSIPVADGDPADVVLGQADFAGHRPNAGTTDTDGDGDTDASAGSFHYPSGVWADATATYVADTYNHRVIVFGPIEVGETPMPVDVWGQVDFSANDPNSGAGWFEPDSDRLARPTDLVGLPDGSVAVSDGENNRIVVYAGGLPTVVLGQPDFVSNVSRNYLGSTTTGWPVNESSKLASDDTLRTPFGLVADSTRLFVADTGNHRTLAYTLPLSAGMAATEVFGQPDFTSRKANDGGVGAASLASAEGVAIDRDGFLIVADTTNHRLLRVGVTGSADRVFGQTVFERNGPNRSAPSFGVLDSVRDVAVDGTALWVADATNHRVVAYLDGNQLYVIGQPDFGGNQPNAGGDLPTATSLRTPTGLWTDGNRMVIADRDNHRVLIWNEVPRALSVPADLVLGQPDMQSGAPNRGAGVAADSMLTPEGVWMEGDALYVADTGNNRVLVWATLPGVNGAPASTVLCQARSDRNGSNRGSALPTAQTCSAPADVIVIDEQLWVADTLNHRVLRFGDLGSDGASANLVLGQPDFESRLPLNEDLTPDAFTMSNPSSLAWDGANLFVSDSGNHRVLIYDQLPDASSIAATAVLGQPGFDSGVATPNLTGLEAPRGLAVVPMPHHSTRLWVADSGKERVVAFDRIARRF